MNFEQLQQPAGVAGGSIVPSADLHSACDRLPRLHSLSVEHAAIALNITRQDLQLVTLLGLGLSDREIARRMAVSMGATKMRLRSLRDRTRMSRLSLAVLGYQLSGQCDEQKAA